MATTQDIDRLFIRIESGEKNAMDQAKEIILHQSNEIKNLKYLLMVAELERVNVTRIHQGNLLEIA